MTERFLLKAGPQMLKATRAQSHFSAPALTKECFKRVRIVRQDFRRDLLRVSVCRRYPSQSDYETGHPRFPISPQARRGLHFDLDYWYLFKRLTVVSAGLFYRFEHRVTYSSFKAPSKQPPISRPGCFFLDNWKVYALLRFTSTAEEARLKGFGPLS